MMDHPKTPDGRAPQERAKVRRFEARRKFHREVLRVGELPDDVVRDIEEAEYGVAPSVRPAERSRG